MSTAISTKRSWSFRPRFSSAGPPVPALNPSSLRKRAKAASTPWLVVKNDRTCRALNIVAAFVLIVLAAPLMLVIALAVKLTSRGPVIYKQPRVGVDRRLDRGPGSVNHRRTNDFGGKLFTIYKFRTMRASSGGSRQVWASPRDPRITAVGRVLRAYRLDELPQLFNVLKGDMNIVGPRPEQPEIFQDLRKEVGYYRDRQRVLPGITGLAQVTCSYDRSLADVKRKVRLDLEYIRERSAAKDLLIMAKTMPVMVFRKGAI